MNLHIFCLGRKSDWWLNIPLNQIKETCERKGANLFNNLVDSVQNLKEICKVKYAIIEKEFWKSYSNITLKFMLHEYCYNDLDIRLAVLNMINHVQSCVKKRDRLKKSTKQIVMRTIFGTVCSTMELCKNSQLNLKYKKINLVFYSIFCKFLLCI